MSEGQNGIYELESCLTIIYPVLPATAVVTIIPVINSAKGETIFPSNLFIHLLYMTEVEEDWVTFLEVLCERERLAKPKYREGHIGSSNITFVFQCMISGVDMTEARSQMSKRQAKSAAAKLMFIQIPV